MRKSGEDALVKNRREYRDETGNSVVHTKLG